MTEERDALVKRLDNYLRQLAPHIAGREAARLLSDCRDYLSTPPAGEQDTWLLALEEAAKSLEQRSNDIARMGASDVAAVVAADSVFVRALAAQPERSRP